MLDYSARIDKAELTAETLRVPLDELTQAHAEADPELLGAVRRVRERIRSFRRRFCSTTFGSSGRAGIWSSATGRWIAWAFACPAGRRPILRPC